VTDEKSVTDFSNSHAVDAAAVAVHTITVTRAALGISRNLTVYQL
jgi:hypothetical protein